MPITNFEFKASVTDIDAAEQMLAKLLPKFIGEDFQTDSYFNVTSGRLKLREGNIEHALIWYNRENIAGAKQSDILLYQPDNGGLKEILIKAIGVKVVVSKRRRIYFIDNVKFHFDRVEGLGNFIEVEAIDSTGETGVLKLKEQCAFYQTYFGLNESNMISDSYSDMILKR